MAVIRKRGEAWQAWVRRKKDGVTVYEESRNFPTERLAKDWAKRLEADLLVNGTPKRVLSTKTLGELLEDYKASLNAVNPDKPIRRQMRHQLDQMSRVFASVKLSELRPKVFSDYAVRRKSTGTGASTVKHDLVVVQGCLNAAKTMYGLEIDASSVKEALSSLTRLGVVGESEERSRRPTAKELAALDAEFTRIALHPQALIPMALFIKLAIALPRRLSELCSMLWENYDGKQIKLLDTKSTKGVRNEVIPVPASAAALINAMPKIDARIFPFKAASAGGSFTRACARLNIADLHFHDLRHEGISRLFELGLDIPEVALISGHQSWATLKRYTHIKPSGVLAKLEKGGLNASRQKTSEAAA